MPVLFIFIFICNEGFTSLLKLAHDDGLLKGVKASGSGPRVSHLLFADDSLVFGEASIEGLNMWGKS